MKSHPPILKVCGNCSKDNIKEIVSLSPDYLGFILFKDSPRGVLVEDCADLLSSVPPSIKTVAVIVDFTLESLKKLCEKIPFSAIQLHGEQPLHYILECKDFFVGELIKVFSVDSDFSFETCDEYDGLVDYFLFDTKSGVKGGSGNTFDWKKLSEYQGSTPYFLAGGIDQTHAQEIKELYSYLPTLIGVDINSKFETSPGIKSIEQVKSFVGELRA